MDYISQTHFDSELMPGWRYQFHKISHGRRIQLRQANAGVLNELREARSRLSIITRQVDEAEAVAKNEPCTCRHEVVEGCHMEPTGRCKELGCNCRRPELDQALLDEESRLRTDVIWNDLVVDKLYPALIRWALIGVTPTDPDGPQPTIDGAPITADLILDRMPDEIIIEVGQAIDNNTKLSFEEQRGFK